MLPQQLQPLGLVGAGGTDLFASRHVDKELARAQLGAHWLIEESGFGFLRA